ncbi:hypothetical protein HD806DRAFT_481939 [Xylariaceae sp. AK1471]|nr:hypothetical protein HD806DRAFT_481939 [Xylariaceae sp. AK1471]
MGMPFQCLSPLGEGTLFCAAKGYSIQTFDLSADSQHLFSWNHPSAKQAENGNTRKDTHEGVTNEEQTGQQSPSKRRKLDSNAGSNAGADDGQGTPQQSPSKRQKLDFDDGSNAEAEDGQGTPDIPATREKEKKQKKANAKGAPPKAEPPFVILLTATEDGSHIIAVTGQDKTLWVFEHDGKGLLKEVSQRAMPKRPCSLALTADEQTILSADKFGDVYALPLILPAEDSAPTPASASSTPAPASNQPLRGANEFTVHSQRNRRALEDQIRQREANSKRDMPKEGPKFAHEVLLGHVSMLTCVLTARDSQNRPYIITADRDEHIRVSRGMPQTYVIETYCLGHGSFVNALCNPRSRPEILISGGGDNGLFVWDWLAGKLLGTADLLVHVRGVLPDATKIAVVKLFTYEVEDECYVVAICERVPALFFFQLQNDNTLSYKGTVGVGGNPLDITTFGVAGQALLVAVDPAGGDEELLVFERNESLWGHRGSIQGTTETGEHLVISREDLDKALYTVENLRKTEFDDEGDAAAPETPEQSSGAKPEN